MDVSGMVALSVAECLSLIENTGKKKSQEIKYVMDRILINSALWAGKYFDSGNTN